MKSLTEALEKDGVVADPLEIVANFCEHELQDWVLLGSQGGMAVFALGAPISELILCYDRDGRRECVRFNSFGKEVARVIGSVVGCLANVPSGNNRVDSVIDGVSSAVDRVVGATKGKGA